MKEFEKEYFEKRNPGLESKHEFEVRKWIQYFSLEPGDKVFEHGCGYGQRLHWFIELGMNAWGMDVSEYANNRAYGKAKGRIDNEIPCSYSRNSYDLVVSVDILEHIPEDQLISTIIKLANLSIKAVYGITYVDNHNFPKDSTHVTGKTKQEWKEFLGRYYDRIYDASQDWYEHDMYLICYRDEKCF